MLEKVMWKPPVPPAKDVSGDGRQFTSLASTASQSKAQADGIARSLAAGKGIDQIVKEHRGWTRQQVLAQLRAAGYEVKVTEPQAGETRVTQVRDPKNGKTVTEYSDFQHGTYYTAVKAPGGEEVSTPVRDGLGRKVTSHRDASTGAITTRYEDDLNLSGGTTVETTRLADGTMVTKTTQRGGATGTEVTAPDGQRTKLVGDQQPTREGMEPILEGLARGKSIDQIVKEHPGWTREQVAAQLRAAGYEVKVTEPQAGETRVTQVRDPKNGKTVTEYSDFQHGTYYTAVKAPGGEEVSTPVRDGLGRKVTSHRDASTGAITTRYEDDLNLSDGRTVETTRLADGTMVTKTTQRNGATGTVVTTPDGQRTKLAQDQKPTREGAQPILKKIAAGKTIDEIVKEHPGWTREQVLAQLRAAGYEVKETTPTSNGTSGTTQVRDPHTGKVVASYSGNGPDGPYTSQLVNGDGDTITVTRDSQGKTTRKVVESNGRQTTTTTQEVDGKTKKTVKVTFNGYTLTTGPDGKLALTDSEGNEVKIKPGAMLEGLARTLLAANPNSSDPAERKEGEIVKTFIEGVFAGERLPDLIAEARGLGEETQRMLAKYGDSHIAQPIRDKDKNIIDPIGLPPAGNAPSGGKWVPVKIQGQWKWVDPKVAHAMAAENVALSRVAETRAKVHRSQAQFDALALDPAYKGALADARRTINKALAPYGLQWNPPKPKGTLEAARQRLAGTETMLKNASGARSEYEQAARILNNAITRLNSLSVPLVTAPVKGPQVRAGGVNHALQDAQDEEARTKAVSLFSEVGLHMSRGDKLSLDYLVGLGEQNLAASKGTPQYKKLEAAVADLKQMQTAAGQQLELAEAYHNFYQARGDASALRVLGQKLLAEYNSKNQFLFEPNKKHSTYGGKYLGKFTGQEIEVRDGQAWVVNHFEEGTTEQQLTYAPDAKNVRGEYRDRALNKEWQTALKPNPSVCQNDPLQAELQAGKNLNTVLKQQIDGKIKLLDGTIRDLQNRYDGALKEHGPGSTEAPAGMLPKGTQPVEIDVGGHKIKVAPEVASQYEKGGLEALAKGGKPVWIEIERDDGSRGTDGRWVDPELAVLRLRLSVAQTQRQGVSDLRSEVEGFSAWYTLRQQEPAPLVGTDPGLDKASLDHHQQLTLDAIYQPQYQAMLRSAQNDNGSDFEFRRVEGSTLEATVSRMLGLGGSSEGRKALKEATQEIRGIGDKVDVRVVPLFHVDGTGGSQQIALLAVKGGDGKTWYIDAAGMKFESLKDFQDNNRQFGENGKLVVPAGLEMKAGADGKIALDVVKARNVSVQEKIIDPVVGLVGTVATVASFSGVLAPVAAPVALASGAYLGGRTAYMQTQYLTHGGEWGDSESLMNMGMMATVALPVGSSTLRTIGMAGKPLATGARMSLWNASRASIGAVRANSELATAAGTYMRSTTTINRVARGMDWSAIGIGAPLMAASAHNLFLYGDQMSGLQLADALTGLGVGAIGTGMGVRNLRATKPQTQSSAMPRSGTIELVDETGRTITARHLGPPPKSSDDILLPEPDGTQPRGDDPRHQSKTHILVRDPDTGEAVVLPYVRGASSEHTPNPAGEPDPSTNSAGETTPKQKQPEQPAPKASSSKPAETSPTETKGPPALNVKRAAAYILAARVLAAAFGHLTGITTIYNAMSGQGASTAAYYRSALSKLAWYTHNHGMIDVFELAAKGEVDKAMARLNKIVDRAQKKGAAPLNEEETEDLRALVQRVGNHGAAYRAALETLDPAMRDTLPAIRIRDLPLPEEVIRNWLPENLESLPEIDRILTAMSEEPSGEYSGKKPAEILADLSRKFDLLADIDGEGPIRNRLLATKEAREAYRALYGALKEALPSGSDRQRIDHKAAEKKPGSSMAPDTWRGYLFKLGSFGGAFNVLLAWGSKGMPSHGGSLLHSFVGWGGYLADPAGVVPATIVQWKYLKALRELSDYKADHPYPRTPEQEEQLAILEARRKRLNTLADYTSIASGIRNILVGAQYLMGGNYPLALGSFLQAGSSFGWVLVQQTPKSLKIAPGTKQAIRYSSISLGIVVPTAIMLWKILADEEQKKTGPSMYGLATEGYRDLSQAVGAWGKALGLDELLGYQPSDLAFAKAIGQMANVPFDPSLMPGQNGYPDLRSIAVADPGADDPTWPFGIEGRGNPRLEREGFAPVLAQEGDTISRIARAYAADVASTVMLNMDHIADPSLIFPGDRIYLPA
ncbi:MAG: hypothetical protein E5X80_08430 [Mesorhizobium sp.]|uniref:LysM peptidoglycan-binding domain-containing protein n=1 Tax=Mesorhizobium sp. TaxID=1871066 RepID=UPI00121CBE46|nr:LysM peptidoglycan-binding domain-containing protein [Mesorhizobium sp.]TIO53897.1 MAG: hypothetical protein E5X78_05970 [Mesorhizobium sp.]TIO61524.1 MAG: hypothetical protein E5X79_07115 [Mesorhizobium sp.]TJV65910.1 MAG: hypothetical protein E5X80_08430 [Mesorhizobium sp.]